MNDDFVLTTCPFCGCGCNFYLTVVNGQAINVEPCFTDRVSQGKLCIKGRRAHEFIHSPERLQTPLVRRNGELKEASWDEAMDFVAQRLRRIKETSSADAIGLFSSAKCTNEENYLLMKLARAAIGTNNVDHCARLCHASTVVGLAAAFGSGAMTNSIPEVEEADCILITGSNTIEQHPLIGSRVLAAKERGATLIVVDPRETLLSNRADFFLRQRPGTDVAWMNGFMNVIINEGLHDRAFIEERTEGSEELFKTVADYDPEKVERITGIPADQLIQAARAYAGAKSAMLLYSMGITQHSTGTDNVKSTANLAMLTGNIGRPSTGVNPLRGQNNVQGACDMGALPNVYSGYQKVADADARTKFERAWGRELPADPGLTLVEMMNAAGEGQLRALYIMGENPMVSDPDINHVREALKRLDLLVVQDIFLTETAELADVVLPGACFAEKEGTFTNTDRTVLRVRKAVEPPGQARPDWRVLCDLAQRLGYDGFAYSSAEDIMAEIVRLTPSYGGISYERLDRGEAGLDEARDEHVDLAAGVADQRLAAALEVVAVFLVRGEQQFVVEPRCEERRVAVAQVRRHEDAIILDPALPQDLVALDEHVRVLHEHARHERGVVHHEHPNARLAEDRPRDLVGVGVAHAHEAARLARGVRPFLHVRRHAVLGHLQTLHVGLPVPPAFDGVVHPVRGVARLAFDALGGDPVGVLGDGVLLRILDHLGGEAEREVEAIDPGQVHVEIIRHRHALGQSVLAPERQGLAPGALVHADAVGLAFGEDRLDAFAGGHGRLQRDEPQRRRERGDAQREK